MKIGIYCTNNYSFPLPKDLIYANIDVAVSEANALAQMGIDVTLFAPIGTQTKAKLVTFDMLPFSDLKMSQAYPDGGSSFQYENIMMIKALNYMEENGFDVFQSHCRPFSVINFAPLKPSLPVVSTVHDPLTAPAYNVLPLFNQFKNLHLISLSKSQQTFAKDVQWEGYVHNGIDIDFWKFKSEKGEYLVYCGRIMPEKGADLAVQIALKSGLPLKIMGNPNHAHESYFKEKIEPFLNEKIQFLGSVERVKQIEIYQNALAILVPIRWPEPFGLVMIEAGSCGVPVVAARNGAVPEIVSEGQNGFIVDDPENIDEFVKKLSEIEKIERSECRKIVEEKFSVSTMSKNYLEVYQRVISR